MPCDYKLYPKNWKEIRARIQQRAGDKCEWCGLPNYCMVKRYSTGKTIKVICTTAHLNHEITDNRDENLAFLCQKCHNSHDAKNRSGNARKTRDKKNGVLTLNFEAGRSLQNDKP
jgi:ribosomal protein L15E